MGRRRKWPRAVYLQGDPAQHRLRCSMQLFAEVVQEVLQRKMEATAFDPASFLAQERAPASSSTARARTTDLMSLMFLTVWTTRI